MHLARWIRKIFSTSPQVVRKQQQTVLNVERLEDRCTPSITLTNPGTLSSYDGDVVSRAMQYTDSGNSPSFSASNLPSGLSINMSTGVISGTAASWAHTMALYSTSVTIMDMGTMESANQTFTWNVSQPTVTLTDGDNLTSHEGDPVSYCLSAVSSANHTLTFSVTGMLPSGLTINSNTGEISGTVSSGAMSFSPFSAAITATDSAANVYDSDSFSWTIPSAAAAVDIEYNVAMNQTFTASAEVGLLTDLYRSWSQNFSVVTITTNDGTFNAEETATFTSGAEITVASDGGVVFHPATDFAGTESFTFSTSYGQQTESATVYLAVVDSDEAQSSGQFSFTNGGSLAYTGTYDNDATTYTVSQIPFFRRLQNRRVIIGDLCGRRPDVTISSTLTFGDNSTTAISTRVQDFTFAGGHELHTQVRHVRLSLKTAIEDLQSFIDNREEFDPLPAQVARWFEGSDYQSYMADPTLAAVISCFNAVATGLDGNTTIFRDNPDLTDCYGYVDLETREEVEIGTFYHESSATDKDKYGTIIHELSHLYGLVDDFGYFNNPGALNGDDIVWTYGGVVVLTNSELRNNADSYAGYLTQYYYD
ncbi:MAG: hypothetical protein EXR98_19010 [Gemmataceae bacterium]|nr:hypothetical protein [Gemmataceae bacterium]